MPLGPLFGGRLRARIHDDIGPLIGPPPRLGVRLWRALGVAGVFGLCALPALLGNAPCSFAATFGRPCPGCGMTRAIHLALAGDLAGSLRMHPLAIPAVAVNVAIVIEALVATASRGSPLAVLVDRRARRSLIGFVTLYLLAIALWLLRLAGLFGGPVSVGPT